MITRIEEWIFPTSHPTLEPHDIHLWFVELDRTAQSVERLSMALSADERARAARFHFERHGRRFAVARGILRDVLSRYVGCDASRLVFAYDRTGKPTLGAGCGAGDGLARPLDTFAVTVDPVGPARLLWVVGQPEETGRVTSRSCAPAIAVPGVGDVMSVAKFPGRLNC